MVVTVVVQLAVVVDDLLKRFRLKDTECMHTYPDARVQQVILW